MIIKVSIKLEMPFLPLDYRPVFISLIKNCMSKYSIQEYNVFYPKGLSKEKAFTFTVKMSSPVFQKDFIELKGDKLYLILSSADQKEALILYNCLIKNTGTDFPLSEGNSMHILSVKASQKNFYNKSETVIRFLSPLVVRQHFREGKDRYYIYDDKEFPDCLKNVLSRQLKDFGIEQSDIVFEPIIGKKTVVKAFGNNIRSSLGTYKISSSPEVIDFLFKAGMGSRRSQGFGMFEIIG